MRVCRSSLYSPLLPGNRHKLQLRKFPGTSRTCRAAGARIPRLIDTMQGLVHAPAIVVTPFPGLHVFLVTHRVAQPWQELPSHLHVPSEIEDGLPSPVPTRAYKFLFLY